MREIKLHIYSYAPKIGCGWLKVQLTFANVTLICSILCVRTFLLFSLSSNCSSYSFVRCFHCRFLYHLLYYQCGISLSHFLSCLYQNKIVFANTFVGMSCVDAEHTLPLSHIMSFVVFVCSLCSFMVQFIYISSFHFHFIRHLILLTT